jgi:DNA-binding NarL/FixJ family response regulator
MRIVVAEDATLVREGIVHALERRGFEVVAEAADASAMVEKVRVYRPDVVVVDIRMPPTNTDDGLRAALRLRAELPGLGVLVLSQYVEEVYARELLAGDPRGIGYLLKDRVADLGRFADAVRTVGSGGSVLDPEVVAQLVGQRPVDDPLAALTGRERAVLELMAQGRSNAAIARALVVAEPTVEKHVRGIFGKLGLPAAADDHRRVLAVLAYLRS